MCSILCWILSIWEAQGCIFWLDSCIVNMGEKFEHIFGLLNASKRFLGGFEPFLVSVVHQSDRLRSPVWPVRVLVLFICWAPVWPVVLAGLTSLSWAVAVALFREVVHMHSSRGSCIGSGGACMCAGGAHCGFLSFGLVVCALCSSIVLSEMCQAVTLS
jgi:hypothetical protein